MKGKILLVSLVLAAGCSNPDQPVNNDVVKEPDRNGSIETVVSVKHDSLFDLLTTKHKVWVHGKLEKTLIKTDTLTALGDTLREDEKGNKKNLKKDYEFYITVQ